MDENTNSKQHTDQRIRAYVTTIVSCDSQSENTCAEKCHECADQHQGFPLFAGLLGSLDRSHRMTN